MDEKINIHEPEFYIGEGQVEYEKKIITCDVMICGEPHEVRVWSEQDNASNDYDSGWEFEHENSVAWFKTLPEETQEAFEDWMTDEGIREIFENY